MFHYKEAVLKIILMNSVANKHKKNYICFVKNLLSRIFTVYILLLALIPCADVCTTGACLSDDKIHIEQNSRESDHCDDMCSPLCVCLCCNDVTSVSEIFNLNQFSLHTRYNQLECLHSTYHFSDSASPPPKA